MKSKPTLKWPEPLFRLLMRVVYKFKNFKIFVIFCFHIVARTAWKWEKAGKKGTDTHTHASPIYKWEWVTVAHTMAVIENGKYGKPNNALE